MLSVVTWLWATPGFRSAYTAEHVNAIYRSVRKHYLWEFRPVCVTDMPQGLAADVHVVPLWDDFRTLTPPGGDRGHPACYGRLRAYAPEMRELLGPRFVSIDLDAVIVGDITPLWVRPEPFVIWEPGVMRGRRAKQQSWNGSMWMMDAGAHPRVWDKFTGQQAARRATAIGFSGNDQGWMQYVIKDAPVWTPEDGVLSYSQMFRAEKVETLPEHARIVFFNGKRKPWDADVRAASPWIVEHTI